MYGFVQGLLKHVVSVVSDYVTNFIWLRLNEYEHRPVASYKIREKNISVVLKNSLGGSFDPSDGGSLSHRRLAVL